MTSDQIRKTGSEQNDEEGFFMSTLPISGALYFTIRSQRSNMEKSSTGRFSQFGNPHTHCGSDSSPTHRRRRGKRSAEEI